MIPKVIHYCWFGGKPLPSLAKKCIKSWEMYFPGYEIKRWDESNFDVNSIPYTKEAYAVGKYAFVSDYARFKILYEYGGLYFDTDVQVIRSLDDILAKGAFMGCQNRSESQNEPYVLGVNPGLGLGVAPGLGLGTTKQNKFYKEIIDFYNTIHFIESDGGFNQRTVVDYTTEILVKHGLRNTPEIQQVAGIWIYPWDYFCPMSPTLVLNLTENSRTIHLFNASWCTKSERLRKKVKRLIGYRFTKLLQPLVLFIRKKIGK